MNHRVAEIHDRLDAIELAEVELRDERVKLLAELKEHMKPEPPPLTFWMFKGTTSVLLVALWNAPNRKLSYQEIREDVMRKEEDSIDGVMSFVKRARKEMRNKKDFHYEIDNIQEWGYQLVHKESCQNLSKTSKTPRKRRKNDKI